MSQITLLTCPFCGSPARRHRYHGDASRHYYGCSSDRCPGHLTFQSTEDAEAITAWNTRAIPLATTHQGMHVCGPSLLSNPKRAGMKFMFQEMDRHLKEMAQRYYAGDVAVVDEFLQLYSYADKRPAIQ